MRRLAKYMTNKEYMWMFAMYGMINMLSIVEFMIWKGEAFHNGEFSFFITKNYVFFPLMGYFIEHRLKKQDFNKKNLAVLLVISFIAIVISCLISQYRSTLLNAWDENNCQTFFNTLIFVPAVTVFYAAKMFFIYFNVSDRTRHVIAVLGDTTFGVYLIEYFCRDKTSFIFDFLKPIIHTLPACWIWIAVACLLGMSITYFLKKIPLIDKFI